MKALLILLLFITCGRTTPDGYNIYLCIGQSNMAGRAVLNNNEGSTAYLWNNSGGWEIADNDPYGVNRYSSIESSTFAKLSPAWSFGKEMAERSRRKVGLVVQAKGGTTIQQWKATLLTTAILRLENALRENPDNRLVGIIWHQGEANSNDYTTYINDLQDIVTRLRSRFGNVRFVCSEVYLDSRFDTINSILLSVPQFISNADCVKTDSLTVFDGVHFDNASQVELGMRYSIKF